MANYDRGVYEPSDEVRVFDGSEEDDDVEGSRLPLLIVLALLVLAMFGGVVWLAYTQGVARGRGETPVLTAAAGPEKVAPPQAGGGNNVPYQGFKIYEQPAPPDDSADNAPPVPKPAAAPEAQKPAPVATAPAEMPKPAPAPAAPPKPVLAAPAPQPAPVAIAPKPAAPPAAKPNSVAALIQQANNTPAARPAPPAAAPAGPATGAPRPLGRPVAAEPKSAIPAPAASGAYVLQIGAYKSQADANAAWSAYKARHAALLSGYAPDVKQADLGEKGTWYRLRVAGFSDREVAGALCERLKADGGACILAK